MLSRESLPTEKKPPMKAGETVLSELRPGTERRGKLSPLPLQKGPFGCCLSPRFAPFGTVFLHLTQAFPAVV
jgi:hypothetical protein